MGRVTIDAFMDWLRVHRAPPADLPAYKTGAEGILALARGGRVLSAHVAQAVMLARDAGLGEGNLVNLLKIGSHLIRFQAEASGAVAPHPPRAPSAAAAGAEPEIPDGDEVSGLFQAPSLSGLGSTVPEATSDSPSGATGRPSAAMALPDAGGRATGAMAAALAAGVDGRPSGAMAAPAAGVDGRPSGAMAAAPGAAAPAAPAKRSSGRKVALALGGVALLAAAAFFGRGLLPIGMSAADAPAAPSRAGTAAATPLTVPHLGIRADFPAGWRHSPTDDDTQPGPAGAQVKTSIVFRGGSAKDPDEGAFLGVLPLTGTLAGGAAVSDATLLAVAGSGQQGGAALIAGGGANYQSEGCSITTVGGRRASLCRGTVVKHGQTVALRTYLLLGPKRAVMALFQAKGAGPDAAARADRVVASLTL